MLKISLIFHSEDPYFYLKPLLFLSHQHTYPPDLENVIGAEYRLSSCQAVIFDRQQQCFFVHLSALDRDITHLTLVICAPPHYHFHPLKDYRISIDAQQQGESIYFNSTNQVIDKTCDFVKVFNLIRHHRHSGWYIQPQSQALFGNLTDLYATFDYQNYFPEPVLNVKMV